MFFARATDSPLALQIHPRLRVNGPAIDARPTVWEMLDLNTMGSTRAADNATTGYGMQARPLV